MANTTNITVKVVGDVSDLEGKMNKAGDSVEQLGDKAEKTGKRGSGLKGAFSNIDMTAVQMASETMANLGGKVIEFGKSAIEATGSAQAMNAQFNQVFGDMANQATQNLNQIADDTSILPNRLKPTFTQMAAFAKTTGMDTKDALDLTTRATRAAADSAAFYDRSIGDVSESLQSYLKGNYENDAALGISSTETTRNAAANKKYGKSFKDLSEAQKQLTLLQMVEDGNKLSGALGQASREGDGLENVMGNMDQSVQDFQATIGQEIFPVFIDIMQELVPIIQSVAEWFGKLPAPIKQATVVVGALLAGFAVLAPVITAIIVAVTSLGAAFLPVVAVIAGVIAAITAIVVAILNWGKITEWASNLWESFTNWLGDVWKRIADTAVSTWDSIAQFFSDLWNSIVQVATNAWNAFSDWIVGVWNGIVDAATGIWNGLVDFFTGLWDGIVNIAQAAWDGFVTIIQFAWELVKSVIQSAITFVTAIIQTGFNIIAGIAQTIWSLIGDTVMNTWQSIVDTTHLWWNRILRFLESIWNLMVNQLIAVWGKLTEIVTTVWNAISNVISTVWNAIATTTSNIWNSIVNFITPIFNKIKDTAVSVWNAIKTTVANVWNAIKTTTINVWKSIVTTLTNLWNGLKQTVTNVFNSVKTTVTNVWNSMKSTASSVWNGIKSTISNIVNSIKTAVVNAFNTAKNTVTNIWNGLKSTASNVWNGIKNAIMSPIKSAIDFVGRQVDRVKGFFSGLKIELPHIKLPHFSIEGSFSLKPPSVPHLGVSWYKTGGVFNQASVIGVGEEPGVSEAVLPLKASVLGTIGKMIVANMPNTVTKEIGGQQVVNNVSVEVNGNIDSVERTNQLADVIVNRITNQQTQKATAWS